MNYRARVDVLRNVGVTKSPFGGTREDWQVARRLVPCDVQRETGREVRTDAGTLETADYIVLADCNPPWGGKDRLRWNGRTFSIIDVDPDVAQRGHHSETLIRKTGGTSG